MRSYRAFFIGLIISLGMFLGKIVPAASMTYLNPISLRSTEIKIANDSNTKLRQTRKNQSVLLSNIKSVSKNTELGYPFAEKHEITSYFGWRKHPISGQQRKHTGIDIGAPQGTPVLAARSGKVVLSRDWGGYGKTIILQHENPRQQTLYAHLSQINVLNSQSVEQGNIIGNVGSTGNVTGAHLHFELKEPDGSDFVAVNPEQYLGSPLLPSNAPSIAEIPDCNVALFGICEPAKEPPSAIRDPPNCDVVLYGDCI